MSKCNTLNWSTCSIDQICSLEQVLLFSFFNCSPEQVSEFSTNLPSPLFQANYGFPNNIPIKLTLSTILSGLKSLTKEDLKMTDKCLNWAEVDLSKGDNFIPEEEQKYLRGDDLDGQPDRFPMGKTSGQLRAVLIWLRHAVRAITALNARDDGNSDKRVFSGPFESGLTTRNNPGFKELGGLEAEDLSRFFCFMAWVKKRHTGINRGARTREILDEWVRKDSWTHSTDLVWQPLYKVREGARAPTAKEVEIQTRVTQRQNVLMMMEQNASLRPARGSNPNDARIDEITDVLTKGLDPGSLKLKGKKPKNHGTYSQAPAIELKLLKAAIAQMHESLVVYHDRTEKEARDATTAAAKEGKLNDRADLAQHVQAAGDYQDLNADIAFDGDEADWRERLKQQQEADRDFARKLVQYKMEHDDADPDKEAFEQMQDAVRVHKAFHYFQRSINSLSATAPKWHEVIKKYGLQVCLDEPEDDFGLPVIRCNGVRLFPHQVEGVGWVAGMLMSSLRCCVLADETGLGKTITSYSAADLVRDQIEKSYENSGGKL